MRPPRPPDPSEAREHWCWSELGEGFSRSGTKNQVLRICLFALIMDSLCTSGRDEEVAEQTLQGVVYELAQRRPFPASAAKLRALPPYGAAFSARFEMLYFGDPGRHRVQSYDVATGSVATVAGGGSRGLLDGEADKAKFAWPYGVALSPDEGTLYVADSANACVRAVTLRTGEVATLAGGSAAGLMDGAGREARFSWPYAVAASPCGKWLFVADSGNHRVRQVSVTTGRVRTLAGDGVPGHRDGPAPTARFYAPRGLATSLDGAQLFVADFANHAVRCIRLRNLQRIETDLAEEGSVYQPEDENSSVVSTLDSGKLGLGLALGLGFGAEDASNRAGQLALRPGGVAVTKDGRAVLVADASNRRVSTLWLNEEGEVLSALPPADPSEIHTSRDGPMVTRVEAAGTSERGIGEPSSVAEPEARPVQDAERAKLVQHYIALPFRSAWGRATTLATVLCLGLLAGSTIARVALWAGWALSRCLRLSSSLWDRARRTVPAAAATTHHDRKHLNVWKLGSKRVIEVPDSPVESPTAAIQLTTPQELSMHDLRPTTTVPPMHHSSLDLNQSNAADPRHVHQLGTSTPPLFPVHRASSSGSVGVVNSYSNGASNAPSGGVGLLRSTSVTAPLQEELARTKPMSSAGTKKLSKAEWEAMGWESAPLLRAAAYLHRMPSVGSGIPAGNVPANGILPRPHLRCVGQAGGSSTKEE
mmetsp:Transcript_29441/g.56547  ORF Transcript_29441/g.56547 Transcript_29441/m.56547 type:complete len:705 (-) Transcript_29441:166-2280(-)